MISSSHTFFCSILTQMWNWVPWVSPKPHPHWVFLSVELYRSFAKIGGNSISSIGFQFLQDVPPSSILFGHPFFVTSLLFLSTPTSEFLLMFKLKMSHLFSWNNTAHLSPPGQLLRKELWEAWGFHGLTERERGVRRKANNQMLISIPEANPEIATSHSLALGVGKHHRNPH